MSDDDLGVSQVELDAWKTGEPPVDFVDRVMERAKGAPRPTVVRERSKRWGAVAVAGICVAVAAAVVIGWPGPSVEGAFDPTAREEIRLDGSVLVAEASAEGSWLIEDGRVRVQQTSGSIFYRVERGSDFEVETPAGTVRVRGTCFRVEVSEMRIERQSIASAVGASLLTAVAVVSVYEGKVAVANQHGEEEVVAGEATVVSALAAPDPARELTENELRNGQVEAQAGALASDEAPIEDLDLDALRQAHQSLQRRAEAQSRELARLEEQLREVERAVDRSLFYPHTSEHLSILAETCEVWIDYPPVLGIEPGAVGDDGETLGLSPEESLAVQDAIERLHASLIGDLRQLYIEATGDSEAVASLSPEALMAEIRDKAPEDSKHVFYLISRERAGLVEPTPEAERLPYERAARRYANLGNEFQAILAQAVGPARADELRRVDNGWPWSHARFRGCPDE